MTNLWDGTFESDPTDIDIIGEGNEEFQKLKQAIRERMANDHEMVTTDGGAQPRHGLHKQGSARVYVQPSAPTTLPNGTALGSSDIGRLWFKTSDATLWEYDAVTPWVQIKVDTSALLANAVTDVKLRKSAGLSVIGRSANDLGDVADITGADGNVLRVAGTALGFGTVANAGLAVKTSSITGDTGVGVVLGRATSGSDQPIEDVVLDNATDLLSNSITRVPTQHAVKAYVDTNKGTGTPAALTMNDGGSGDDSGTTFNGASAKTLSYNTLGAAKKSHADTSTDYGAADASNYGHAKASNTTPLVDAAVAVVGSETLYARGDHVHPVDTSRAPTDHKSTGTTYGQGDATNYGHVKVDATAANGSMNAVSSDALYDETVLARNADNLTSGTVALARIPTLLTGKRVYNGSSFQNTDSAISGMYTALSSFIPTIGDKCLLSGGSIVFGMETLSYAERTSSTTIRFYYVSASGALNRDITASTITIGKWGFSW